MGNVAKYQKRLATFHHDVTQLNDEGGRTYKKIKTQDVIMAVIVTNKKIILSSVAALGMVRGALCVNAISIVLLTKSAGTRRPSRW